jgi:hypothetical protein
VSIVTRMPAAQQGLVDVELSEAQNFVTLYEARDGGGLHDGLRAQPAQKTSLITAGLRRHDGL